MATFDTLPVSLPNQLPSRKMFLQCPPLQYYESTLKERGVGMVMRSGKRSERQLAAPNGGALPQASAPCKGVSKTSRCEAGYAPLQRKRSS
jgi:hypothetical protein